MAFFDYKWLNFFKPVSDAEDYVQGKNYFEPIKDPSDPTFSLNDPEDFQLVENPDEDHYAEYYRGYIRFSPPQTCNITQLEINPPEAETSNIQMDGIVLTCPGSNNAYDYNNTLKRYAQPNEKYYAEMTAIKDEILTLIGENSSDNGFLGSDGELQHIRVNALVGKIDGSQTFIPLKITPWTIPGDLLDYNNYIQIMVCEDSNIAIAKVMYKEALKLIAYLLKYCDKDKPSSSDLVPTGSELIPIDSEKFSFKNNYSICLSNSIKEYYTNIFNQSVEEFFLDDLNSVLSVLLLEENEEDSPVQDISKKNSDNKSYYKLTSKEIIINKPIQSSESIDMWAQEKISFSTLIPLIKKVYMQLTGEGIQFYNELLYPKEDLEYFLTNNIKKWNIIDSGLLSSLSFSDINELKAGLMNLKTINNNTQTITTNTEIESDSSSSYSKNYLVYPTTVLNIYRYEHTDSKYPHTDYPWDEDGDPNEERSWFYCPCDKMKIARIYYRDVTNSNDPNVIWLTSTDKVVLANGDFDYVTIMIMHGRDEDINKLSKGQVFTRQDPIILEGDTGYVSGLHFHLSIGTGEINGTGWTSYSSGSLDVKGECIEPQDAFFIDPKITRVERDLGRTFKELKEE